MGLTRAFAAAAAAGAAAVGVGVTGAAGRAAAGGGVTGAVRAGGGVTGAVRAGGGVTGAVCTGGFAGGGVGAAERGAGSESPPSRLPRELKKAESPALALTVATLSGAEVPGTGGTSKGFPQCLQNFSGSCWVPQ